MLTDLLIRDNMTETPIFQKLWELKEKKQWCKYNIYAKTTKDSTNIKAGTRVRVWMVSRFRDVGITDNLINPTGYDVRGLDPDVDLIDFEFVEN